MIPAFNNHGRECSGHANWMLDCTFENEMDREAMLKAVENYIEADTKEAPSGIIAEAA